ncbi:YbgA family protein [Actinomadura gamaensis]|uniref:YbgA family protein n=1 Tax=Actinomadura gamaensis TaxID=1763541 RepID=A0ABV9TQJ6_9ACTN
MRHPRPRIAVSSCLLGEPVRYNGGHCRSRFLTERLAGHVDLVPVCPEMEIGLGAPRPSLRLVLDDGTVRLATRDGSADHTGAMRELAARHADGAAGLDGWVLRSRSPSCGVRGVSRYRRDMPADRRGRGVFAAGLIEARPDLPVEEDGRLNDPVLRAHFIERIFAHARLRALLDGPCRPRDLVAFHTVHKLQLLAHDPARYRHLGKLVASAGVAPPGSAPAGGAPAGSASARGASARGASAGGASAGSASARGAPVGSASGGSAAGGGASDGSATRALVAGAYGSCFLEAFSVRPKRGRHVNALQHVFGPMSERLDDARRRDITGSIDAYGRGEVPLDIPMTLLRHHALGENMEYLKQQTYFEPYPTDLR